MVINTFILGVSLQGFFLLHCFHICVTLVLLFQDFHILLCPCLFQFYFCSDCITYQLGLKFRAALSNWHELRKAQLLFYSPFILQEQTSL